MSRISLQELSTLSILLVQVFLKYQAKSCEALSIRFSHRLQVFNNKKRLYGRFLLS